MQVTDSEWHITSDRYQLLNVTAHNAKCKTRFSLHQNMTFMPYCNIDIGHQKCHMSHYLDAILDKPLDWNTGTYITSIRKNLLDTNNQISVHDSKYPL